jgi:hypothetical protein
MGPRVYISSRSYIIARVPLSPRWTIDHLGTHLPGGQGDVLAGAAVEFGNPTFLLEGGEPLDEMVHRSRVSWMLEEAHTPAKQPSVDFAMQDVSKPLSIFARLRESVTVSVTDRIWTAEAFAFQAGGLSERAAP